MNAAGQTVPVLVVENRTESIYGALAELASETTSETRFEFNATQSLKDAIDWLVLHQNAVCLCQDRLPEGTCLELLEHIAKASREIPVLVLGTVDDDEFELPALRAGAVDYLSLDEATPQRMLRRLRFLCRHDHFEHGVHRPIESAKHQSHASSVDFQLLASAVEYAGGGLSIADYHARDRPLIYVNKSFERVTGYQVEEVIGKNCRFLQGPKTDRTTVDRIRQAINAGEEFEGEILNYRKDGSTFWNFMRVAPIHNDQGQVTHYVGIQTDITVQKTMEKKLRATQQFFDRAINAASVALFEWDLTDTPQTDASWLSPQLAHMLGYKEEELPARCETWESLWHPEDRPAVKRAIEAHLQHGKKLDITYRMRTKAGDIKWFKCRGTAQRDASGRPIRMSGSMHEVTKLIEAQEEFKEKEIQLQHRQRMESVGELAGGIAHEFNNLLQAVIGYTNFAKRCIQPTSRAHEDLEKVLLAANRAKTLTRQLLNFSREHEVQLAPIPAEKPILETIALLEPVIGSDIIVEAETPGAEVTIEADETLLLQVLMNLCLNARDAMPNGGHLKLETAIVEFERERVCRGGVLPPGYYARYRVADSGTGMPEDLQERIFDPFFTTKGVGEGTGLGLSVVDGIIQRHNGGITLHSVPNEGTTFEIFLPARLDRIPEQQEIEGGSEREEASLILVADDEVLVRDLTKRTLKDEGYQVVVAGDGQEAMDAFEQHADSIRLVILDVMMPHLTGREVHATIHATHPHIPTIFCTGYDSNIKNLHELENELVVVIEKPFDEKHLLDTVHQFVNANAPPQLG